MAAVAGVNFLVAQPMRVTAIPLAFFAILLAAIAIRSYQKLSPEPDALPTMRSVVSRHIPKWMRTSLKVIAIYAFVNHFYCSSRLTQKVSVTNNKAFIYKGYVRKEVPMEEYWHYETYMTRVSTGTFMLIYFADLILLYGLIKVKGNESLL
jgi:hypothetical protein